MVQARRFQTQVGIAIETVFGTAVNPTQGVPLNEFSDQTMYDVILDNGLRGIAAMDFKTQQGSGHSELTLEGLAYPEEIGYLIKLIMGAVATAGSGPYTHTFTLGASPQSLTIEGDIIPGTNGALRYKGCRVGQVAFSFDAAEGVLAYSASLMGQISTKVTAQNPARTENNPWEGWRAVITSSGHANRVVSAELTFTRDLEVKHTGTNTQDARYINVGPLRVEGRLVLAAEDMTDYDNFKSHLSQSFQLQLDYGSGANQKTLTFLMTSCNFADGPLEIDRSGVGVVFALPIRGIYNATDAGPAKVTLVNAKTNYTS